MIHFNFTVSEEDAQNIFDCIQSAISANYSRIMDLSVQGFMHEEAAAYRNDIAYLKSLLAIMEHKSVEVAPPDLDGTYTPAKGEKSLAAEVYKELDQADREIVRLQRIIHV